MKIIIQNLTALSDIDALKRVIKVMESGKISSTKGVEHYCHHSVFGDKIHSSYFHNHKSSGTFVLRK